MWPHPSSDQPFPANSPPVYTLNTMVWNIPLATLVSSVLAILSHSFSSSLAEKETLKSHWLNCCWAVLTLKHPCVICVILILNPTQLSQLLGWKQTHWKQDNIHPIFCAIYIMSTLLNKSPLTIIIFPFFSYRYHSFSVWAIPPKHLLSSSMHWFGLQFMAVLQGRKDGVLCWIPACWSQFSFHHNCVCPVSSKFVLH